MNTEKKKKCMESDVLLFWRLSLDAHGLFTPMVQDRLNIIFDAERY